MQITEHSGNPLIDAFLADVVPARTNEKLAHYCRQCENALDEVQAARVLVLQAKRAGNRSDLCEARRNLLFWSRSVRSWRGLVNSTREVSSQRELARRVRCGGR
jgi:hypothetical protein